jgi:uncharacterized membrane protein YoaK (UPF0700 family)
MLIREGDQRTIDVDIRLASVLAGVAGAINAAGFQATGFFSANMTGNVSALSDNAGLGRLEFAALFGGLVAAFVLGAFASGLLINAGRRRNAPAVYAYSIAFEGVLLLVLGCIDTALQDFGHGPLLILGLSFIMGLQNAATTRISNARVRTTHVSGMATDIGLACAALFASDQHRRNAFPTLRLYVTTISAFLVGGIFGVLLYLALDGFVFVLVGALLLTIAAPFIRPRSASGQS